MQRHFRTFRGLFVSAFFFVIGGTAFASTIFVDAGATGANNGSSWTDAFRDLRAALTFASVPGNGVTQVWVAEGTYKPSSTLNDRVASFPLINGVTIYGGFAGGETMLSQRDPVAHPTILSGDLNGDDASGNGSSNCCVPHSGGGCEDDACETAICAEDPFCCETTWDDRCAEETACLCGNLCSTRCDNSYHVVTATGTNSGARIDGFTIRGGNAKGAAPSQGHGGGFYANAAGATIVGCVFKENIADNFGGGAYAAGSNHFVLFSKCDFIDNKAEFGGGAFVEGDFAQFANVRFLGNRASAEGGGLRVVGGAVLLTNNVFAGNTAAGSGGGGLSTNNSTTTLANSVFYANRATPAGNGGGMRFNASTAIISNTIAWANQDSSGVGENAQIRRIGGSLQLSFSDIQGLTGGLGGSGNIGADPRFVDADGPDDVVGTPDDNHRLSEDSPAIDAANNFMVPVDGLDLDSDGNTTELTPIDLSGRPRFINDPFTPDTGVGTPPIVDIGAFEHKSDCNNNGVRDSDDILNLTSPDCNENNVPDECEISLTSTAPGGPFYCIPPCDPDCNDNGAPDGCDITSGSSGDFNNNETPDECEPDCNTNGFPDFLDILFGASDDCDINGIPDECEADCDNNGVTDRCDIKECGGQAACGDCNNNSLPDICDINAGAPDCNSNGVPDSCEPDCNNNQIPDGCDIASGAAADCNSNGVPDTCDIAQSVSEDCDNNNVPDECEEDCNSNGVDDTCDIVLGTSQDCNVNGSPDECDLSGGESLDCNSNNRPDECDIAGGMAQDCQPNGVPDSCDILSGNSVDADANGIPDECKPDCNLNGIADAVDILEGTSEDCDGNNVPDECQADCNDNDIADSCDIMSGSSQDCQNNGIPDDCEPDCDDNNVPDVCDLANGAPDLNHNGVLDTCEPDCNANGFPDFLDLFFGASEDCNDNDVPDECDIDSGNSQDVNGNEVPDECETFGDSDNDGDSDMRDLASLQNCFTSSGGQLGGGCAFFDANHDQDVDLLDVSEFVDIFAGP